MSESIAGSIRRRVEPSLVTTENFSIEGGGIDVLSTRTGVRAEPGLSFRLRLRTPGARYERRRSDENENKDPKVKVKGPESAVIGSSHESDVSNGRI
jgi:hypothetical protein